VNWDARPLSEVAEFELGKMLDQAKNKGELLPYLANVNVRWGEFDLGNLREMRFMPQEMERFSLRNGDIVMCEGGEPGRCALWQGQRDGMMFQKALHRIRPRREINSAFLYYVFLNIGRTNGFAPYFTGATIKHLPREQLAKIPIRFPDLEMQKAIAAILQAYDDLIATNQRRIALLEDAARRIYREWFVHLRFPGHETVPVVDGVPRGWRKATLGTVCDETPGASVQTGPFGSQLHSYDYTEMGVPVVMPQDIVGDRIRTTKIAYVADDTAKRLERHALQRLDIVFPRRGDIAKRALVETSQEGYLCGTGCLRIRLAGNVLHPLFLYCVLADPLVVKWIEGQAVGATMLNLSATILRSLEIIVPITAVQAAFTSVTAGLREQVSTLEEQNEKLAHARDLLLPKLMSGQLDVSGIALPEAAA